MTNEELDSSLQIPDCVGPKTGFFCSADKHGKGGVVAAYSTAPGPMPVRVMLMGWVAGKPLKSGIWDTLRWAEFRLN